MSDTGDQSDTLREQRLNEAILRVTELTDSGEPFDMKQLLEEFSDVSDELREFIDDHLRMRRIAAGSGEENDVSETDATLLSAKADSPKQRLDETQEFRSRNNGDADIGRLRYFGDFELLEKIAQGGMGVVFKARQVTLNRIVALKMILSGELATAEDRQRFQIEAEAAAKLDHAGIVPIFEVGEHDERPYLSMGLVEGVSLSAELQEGPLPPREAADLVKQVAEAVHYAHQQGVIHRDLKPGNILLQREPDSVSPERGHRPRLSAPKITDFGLAKRTQENSGVTVTGQILGTPGYMPPEQAMGRNDEVRETADVYSLGAILYATLTGRPPFQADNPLDTMRQVLEREPVRPRDLNPAVPRDLETICLKCLQKSRRGRYPSAQELADDLDRFLEDRPVLARPVGRVASAWRWCRRNPVVATLSALVALSLIVGITVSAYYAIEAGDRADGERQNAEKARIARDEANDNATAAQKAKADATENLRASYLSQADAHRWSQRPESRFEGLEAIRKAAAIRNGPDLINPAIALLARPGMRLVHDVDEASIDPSIIAIDPAMKRYARGDRDDGSISIRRIADQKELLAIPGFGKKMNTFLRFSRNGRTVVAAYQQEEIRLWDAQTGKKQFRITGGYSAQSFDFHPTKPLVAVGRKDGTLALYDVKQNRELYRVRIGPAPYRLRFSRDGRRIATGNLFDGNIRILDAAGGKLLHKLSNDDATRAFDWSMNDEFLATSGGSSGKIYIWDTTASSPKLYRVLEGGHRNSVTQLRFAHRSLFLVSRGWDSLLCLWSPHRVMPLLKTSAGFRSAPLTIGRHDKQIGILAARNRVQIWDVVDGAFRTFGAYRPPAINSFGIVEPNGRWFCFRSNTGAGIHARPSGRKLAFLPVSFFGMRVHPNGKCLFSGSIFGVHCWPISYEDEGRRMRIGPPAAIDRAVESRLFLDLDKRGRILAFVSRGRVKVAEISEAGVVKRWLVDGKHQYAGNVSVHPNGRYVASGTWHNSGTGRNVRIWDTSTGKLLHEHKCTGNSRGMFSTDGKWVYVRAEGQIKRLETGTWKAGPQTVVGSLCTSPDARMLAVHRPVNAIELLDAATLQQVVSLNSSALQRPLGFSGGSAQLFVEADEGELRVWNLRELSKGLNELGLKSPFPPFPPKPTKTAPPLQSAVIDYGTLGPRVNRYLRLRKSAALERDVRNAMGRRDWRRAIKHLQLLIQKRYDERDMAALVSLTAYLGDSQDYRRYARMYQTARSSRRKSEGMAQRRVKHSLLLPGLIKPKDGDVKVLDAHQSIEKTFFLSTRSLLDIRRGNFKDARKRLLQAASSDQTSTYPRLKSEINALLAICQAQLGQSKEAVRLVDETTRELSTALDDVSEKAPQLEAQIGWLHAEIFRREAETLIRGPRILVSRSGSGRLYARIVAYPPDVTVRYTLDGSMPDAKSKPYQLSVLVKDAQRIRAQAFYKDGGKSAVRSVRISLK